LPLLPHLKPKTRFIEPCAGAGRLAAFLESAGHQCVDAFDLPTDARFAHYDVLPGAIFITNPPYWGLPGDLHPLIVNLSNQLPAWLLLPTDWLNNKSSAPLMPRLRMIVSVGRVKWIEGSPHTSKDNAIWALFGSPTNEAIRFVGRLADPPFKASTVRFVRGVALSRAA
jgi:hypothetical protein